MFLHPNDPSIHSVAQLNRLLNDSHAEMPGIKEALFTADQLVRHGSYNGARRVIDKLAACGYQNETFRLRLQRLEKAAAQVQAIPGLKGIFAEPRKIERLLSLESFMLATGGDPRQPSLTCEVTPSRSRLPRCPWTTDHQPADSARVVHYTSSSSPQLHTGTRGCYWVAPTTRRLP